MLKRPNYAVSSVTGWTLLTLFLLSGGSSLVFETLWQRLMTLVFGASATATVAILTSFFVGIALGSYLGGRWLHITRSALRFYMYVECWIALWGLSVPALLLFADRVYISLFQTAATGATQGALLRFAMCVAVTLPATLGMGATIPCMNRLTIEQGERIGSGVSMAYGMNTIGAVTGCLFAGFLLIPRLGMQQALYVAASINAMIAFILLLLSRTRMDPPNGPSRQGVPQRSDVRQIPYPGLMTGLYILAGFLALGFELLWMRILGIYQTNGVLTFTMVLAVYLAGFAIGSLWLFRFLGSRMHPVHIFAGGHWGVAFFSLLSLPAVYHLHDWSQATLWPLAVKNQLTAGHVLAYEGVATLIIVLPATVCMGLLYPALCQSLVLNESAVDRKSGLYYFWGTLGSAAGIVVTGFLLIPKLGLSGAFATLASLSLLAGWLTLRFVSRRKSVVFTLARASCILLCSLAVLYGFRAHPFTREGRVIRVDAHWQQLSDAGGLSPVSIIHYATGSTATVTVRQEQIRQHTAQRRLYVDDQLVASTDPVAKVDSKMLAHLPLMLHPRPKRALTVGFGSGGTSWSMTRHGIEVDCVEIEPEVVRTASLFREQNHGVLEAKNFNIIINDARDYLHVTNKRYDVISTDATNLQYKQNANLYTREYFELMKTRLTPDGIACAWVPMSSIFPDEYKILVRTFQSVYPDTTVWFMNHTTNNFAIFIGTPGVFVFNLERVRKVFSDEAIKADLQEIGVVDPFQLLHFLHLDAMQTRRYVGQGPLHTDDKPILEFSSPLGFYLKNETFAMNLEEMLAFRPGDYERYVGALNAEDRMSFARYDALSPLWSGIVLAVFRQEGQLPRPDRIANLRTGLEMAQKAHVLDPGDKFAGGAVSYFKRRLERLK